MGLKNDEFIAKEIIKPSSPTPTHIETLKLSFLDQIATPIYIPLVLFYSQTSDQSILSSRLKKSLAETLTHYHPLAGSLRENSTFVDCNDVGVQYYESYVTSKLSDIIQKPNPNEMHQLLPFDPFSNESMVEREELLALKSTFFECGGLAIGVCMSHKIADGTSVFTFLNDWAMCSRGEYGKEAIRPIFNAASYFPPKDLFGFKRNISKETLLKEEIVTKRFVFEKSKITSLKQAASGSEVKNPTRVEAVSAFIWQRIMAISRSKSTQQEKAYAAIHVVNLRPRMDPPLPNHSFANLWWRVLIRPSLSSDDQNEEYRTLVSQMSKEFKQVDSEYVKKLQSEDGHVNLINNLRMQATSGETEFCSFTSWCRFPMYEVDFGWGKPSWVFSPIRLFKNLVMLTSTRDGDGIEAWVNLVDKDMSVFERDLELHSFL